MNISRKEILLKQAKITLTFLVPQHDVDWVMKFLQSLRMVLHPVLLSASKVQVESLEEEKGNQDVS